MDKSIVESYKKRCIVGENCDPQYVYKTYANGHKHCSTQCQTCGNSHGNPIARNTIDKSIEIKNFDQHLFDKLSEWWSIQLGLINTVPAKIAVISKQIKHDFFRNTLKIEEIDFENAYEKYLQSEHWKRKRKQILVRDKYTCLYCKGKKAEQVHHMSYRNLGNESDFELMSVCYTCHEEIHKKPDSDLDLTGNYLLYKRLPEQDELFDNQRSEEGRPRRRF